MFKKLLNKKLVKNEKGLTLIELLAVIVILAIIAAIAIPAIGNIIENSRYNAVKADAINVLNAGQLYYTENPTGDEKATGGSTVTSITVAQLKTAKYLDTAGTIPPTATVANANPKTLSNAEVTYSGSKKVTFDGATIEGINEDDKKGSGEGGHTIEGAKESTQ
ncbi:prepilin-type N-terminal cleavage/methylation domain-containing protein [Lysinibacillus fusiformis]|nr:prepilin-type N-terminal cleavage/methylation domain-containing protein [Lysinibacillus fusiformis]